jgi:hypothetical protein
VLSKNTLRRFKSTSDVTDWLELLGGSRAAIGEPVKHNTFKLLGRVLSKNALTRFKSLSEAMLLTGLRFSVVVGQSSSESMTHFDRPICIFWGVLRAKNLVI